MEKNNKNAKTRSTVFLKMKQKNHVFDSVMGAEIVGGGAQELSQKVDKIQEPKQESSLKLAEPKPSNENVTEQTDEKSEMKAVNSTLVQNEEIQEEASED